MKRYDFGNHREYLLSIISIESVFYSAGWIQEIDTSTGNVQRGYALLAKTTENGELIWYKIYESSNWWKKIEPLSDGSLVMAGRIETDNGINEFDIVVTKVDTAGNEIWTYSPIKLEYQSLEGLVVTPNDEIVAYGYDDGKFLLLKLDTDGNLIWEKTYRNSSNSFFNLEVLPDGSFIGCGEGTNFSQSNSVMGTVLKICSEGELEWIRYYGAKDFPSHFYDIEPTHDGGYIAVGSTLGDSGTQDIWVMKMDSLGCNEPGCAENETPIICPDDTLSIYSLNNELEMLEIYPNPFNSSFRVVISTVGRKLTSVQSKNINLYDLLGKKVDISLTFDMTKSNNEFIIDGSQLQKGIYFLEIKTDDFLYAEKIIKE